MPAVQRKLDCASEYVTQPLSPNYQACTTKNVTRILNTIYEEMYQFSYCLIVY